LKRGCKEYLDLAGVTTGQRKLRNASFQISPLHTILGWSHWRWDRCVMLQMKENTYTVFGGMKKRRWPR